MVSKLLFPSIGFNRGRNERDMAKPKRLEIALTEQELWDLIRCSEWLHHEDEPNSSPDERRYTRITAKLQAVYNKEFRR